MKRRRDLDDEFEILHIDETRLDEEWINQPSLYFQYARKLADHRAILEEAKAELRVVEAEVGSRVREDPSAFDIAKPTEASISGAIIQTDEWQEANRALLKARKSVDIYDAAVTALDHRKKALENLVWLHGQNYFSTPRAPDKETGDELDMASKAASRKRHKRRRDDE